MDIFEQISLQPILFFILYGVTGVVPLIAALYLLLRRGNAFAPDVTPPLRLRRWAASFFAVLTLGHVWWLLFYIFPRNIHSMDDMLISVGYWVAVVLDWVTLLPTIAGTLLAMLQDRHRPVWPILAAMIPFVAMGGVIMVNPGELLMQITFAYIILLYVSFTLYIAFALRKYRRWLLDNYADLERKEVRLTHVLLIVFVLLFILYALVDVNTPVLIYFLHVLELTIFGFLLWRVETLPQLELPTQPQQASPVKIDIPLIDQLLKENCEDTQLYREHDLSLQQLAQAVGTNRYYLSLYFSRKGITYNTYINNLRVDYFIRRYQELAAAERPVVAQQLASESGYHSYSTFARAFTIRKGQSVTAWIRQQKR